MSGMSIIAYLSLQRHVTQPYFSQNGADIDIYEPLKVSKHPTMATQNDSMMLQKLSLML